MAVEGLPCAILRDSLYFDAMETLKVGIHSAGGDQADVLVTTQFFNDCGDLFGFGVSGSRIESTPSSTNRSGGEDSRCDRSCPMSVVRLAPIASDRRSMKPSGEFGGSS